MNHFTQNARQSNLKLVMLHILADTLSSIGVIVSTVLVKGKALHVADTVVSLGIATLIVYSVWPFFKVLSTMPHDAFDIFFPLLFVFLSLFVFCAYVSPQSTGYMLLQTTPLNIMGFLDKVWENVSGMAICLVFTVLSLSLLCCRR